MLSATTQSHARKVREPLLKPRLSVEFLRLGYRVLGNSGAAAPSPGRTDCKKT